MARHKILTPPVVASIRSWLEQGFSADEIARKVGCTTGTLRVRCSQLKISFRRSARAVAIARLVGRQQSLSYPQRDRLSKQKKRSAAEMDRSRKGRLLVTISQKTLKLLQTRAALTGLSDSRLAETLLEKIAQDNLYDAVLDE